MSATESPHDQDEEDRRGIELYEQQIRPQLRREDDNKYVVLDIETGDYEIDADDYTAAMRLRARRPTGKFWLERAGHPTAISLRRGR